MTSSKNTNDLLDLERDLPTTAEDIQALRRCRDLSRLDLEAYLHFLSIFDPPLQDVLRARQGPRGALPFELPAKVE